MPDIDSFIVSAKNQEDLKSHIKRKKTTKKANSDDDDEDMDEEAFLNELSSSKNSVAGGGTRSRPGPAVGASKIPEILEESKKPIDKKAPVAKDYQDIKIVYPHKKHQVSLTPPHIYPFLDKASLLRKLAFELFEAVGRMLPLELQEQEPHVW